jgi:hypothetical protein
MVVHSTLYISLLLIVIDIEAFLILFSQHIPLFVVPSLLFMFFTTVDVRWLNTKPVNLLSQRMSSVF